MKSLLYAAALFLAGCGGGGAPAVSAPESGKMARVLVQASDRLQPTTGYDVSIWPDETSSTPEESVRKQGSSAGRLVLWPGYTKRDGFADFARYVDEAVKNPAFEQVYLYDELFWHHDGAFAFGEREAEILEAAAYTRGKGLKAGVSILPDVILNPAFRLQNINAFDVIWINVYPDIRVSNDLHGCQRNDNLTTNLLFCAVQKLRQQGFAGDVWYIYQAFGIKAHNPVDTLAKLSLQAETIRDSASLGVSAIVPWGWYLGGTEAALDADIYQGAGSPLAAFLHLPGTTETRTSRPPAAFFTPKNMQNPHS